MNNGLFTIKWKDVAGAIVSGVGVAVLGYLSTVTNIADINISQLVNIGLIAAITSLLKAFTTDNQGNLLGGSFKIK